MNYGLTGIEVDGTKKQGVPRKTGAYDTEGLILSAAIPSKLRFFRDSSAFGQTLTVITGGKVYGVHTNIISKLGGMGKGERLFVFGLSAKVDALNQALNSANGVVFFDNVRRIWGISHFNFNFGQEEFIAVQARDVPVKTPRPVEFHEATNAAALLQTIDEPGMLNLCINGQPYCLEPQEEFTIEQVFTAPTLPTMGALETHITLKLEGIRIRASKT